MRHLQLFGLFLVCFLVGCASSSGRKDMSYQDWDGKEYRYRVKTNQVDTNAFAESNVKVSTYECHAPPHEKDDLEAMSIESMHDRKCRFVSEELLGGVLLHFMIAVPSSISSNMAT